MAYRIVNTIGDRYTQRAQEVLEQSGTVEYVGWTQQELEEDIGAYDVAIIGLGLRFDKNVINAATNLKVIATATTGLDHIDTSLAKERGIDVLSLKEEKDFLQGITGTAELAWAIMLDLMRGVSHAFTSVKAYTWDRDAFRGHEVKGKTLGLVGLGRLGTMMARYGQAFGMTVIAYDPHVGEDVFRLENVEQVSFDELLKRSDVVSIHVHLDKETEEIFNADAFGQMKDSAYLVNTARGRIVNEANVLLALEQKQIAGYATDVLADELSFDESFSNHPLVEYAKTNVNCIITPHIGGMTVESREATDVFIAEKLKRWMEK